MHPLKQLSFFTQLPLSCDTLLISYSPIHEVAHITAHSLDHLHSIALQHLSRSQCVVLCSDKQKIELLAQIEQQIQQQESRMAKQRESEQLLDGLSGSEGEAREELGMMLQGIVERTVKKVRESKIKAKLSKIDFEIKKFESLQASKAANTVQLQCKPPKKGRKKQKALDKKIEHLKSKREALESSKSGVVSPSTIAGLLGPSSESESSSDSGLLE